MRRDAITSHRGRDADWSCSGLGGVSGQGASRWLALLMVPAFLLAGGIVAGAGQETDVVLRAMEDELQRSMNQLRLEDLEGPYFLEYGVIDTESISVSATFGAVVRSGGSRQRLLRVDIRVGTHELDNSEFLGDLSMFSWSGFPRGLVREDDYDALRHDLWLASDAAYKQALEQLARKRAYVQNRVQEERVPDFSVEEATVAVEPVATAQLDLPAWRERVRRLSAVFREYPGIYESSIVMRLESQTRRLVNSDGSKVRQAHGLASLYATASTQAADGMQLKHYVPFYARDLEGLPSEAQMEVAVRRVADELIALASAPVLDDYIGPVMLSGQAATELFAQVLAPGLAGHRPPTLEDERMAGLMPTSELPNRLGRRVLPQTIDVLDDPTQTAFQGTPLIGGYAVDDQGIRPEPLELVQDGILQTLLMSRRPRKEIPRSNGHGRAASFGSPTAQIGNLFVRSADGLAEDELVQELAALAEEQGLAYGLLIETLDNPSITGNDSTNIDPTSITRLMRGGPGGPQLTSPILTYRVRVENGSRELVRGVSFHEITFRTLRDIVETSVDYHVGNRIVPVGGGPLGIVVAFAPGGTGLMQGIATSVVAPAVLFEELEVRRITGPQDKPVLMTHPFFGKKE